MPGIDDYIEIEFSQGKELRRQMQYDKAAHAGVCMSLVIEFVKQMAAGVDPDEIDEKLSAALRLAAGRQKIFSSGWGDNRGTQAALLTALGEHTGIEARYLGTGNTWNSMVNLAKANPGESLYLYITFAKGAHAIWAAYSPPGLLLFDPNLGVMGAEDAAEVDSLVQLLWQKYSSWGMPIQTWKLYQLNQKETVMEKWKRGAFG